MTLGIVTKQASKKWISGTRAKMSKKAIQTRLKAVPSFFVIFDIFDDLSILESTDEDSKKIKICFLKNYSTTTT